MSHLEQQPTMLSVNGEQKNVLGRLVRASENMRVAEEDIAKLQDSIADVRASHARELKEPGASLRNAGKTIKDITATADWDSSEESVAKVVQAIKESNAAKATMKPVRDVIADETKAYKESIDNDEAIIAASRIQRNVALADSFLRATFLTS